MLAIWPLVPLPFLNPACRSGSSQFTYCWGLAWGILSINLLACEMSTIVQNFEHLLVLPFFGIGMKTDIFQSCGHFWVFQICWHIECSTFTASYFRIWNSSPWIPSLPLALFVVMLPKVHLTSHSRMFDYSWMTTPSWLSDPMDCNLPGSSVHGDSPGKNTGVGCHALQGIFLTQGLNPGLLHCSQILYLWATRKALVRIIKTFLYSSSMYSCHILLMSSAYVRLWHTMSELSNLCFDWKDVDLGPKK